MGQGYSLYCKKCGYTISVNLGIGFMFPRVYEETLENAKAGKLGRNVQQFLKDHPDGALDCDLVLLQCKYCGNYDCGMDLSMYLPKEPADRKQKGIWSTAFPGDNYLYVSPRELKESYIPFASYQHTCGKCGKDMTVIKEREIDQGVFSPEQNCHLLCPKCKIPLSYDDIVMWD